MALSVLVTIEMCNALNRWAGQRVRNGGWDLSVEAESQSEPRIGVRGIQDCGLRIMGFKIRT